MEVSFNGMRRNATRAMNDLKNILETVLDEHDNDFFDNEAQDIKNAFNAAAMTVDSFNCLFDPEVEGDMDDLSKQLSVSRLEDIEEEED